MSDTLSQGLSYDHALMVDRRGGFDQFMEDIREYVRPQAPSHFGTAGTIQNPQLNTRCYDSTALWAAEQLAAGYAGFLVPSNDRWADIILDDNETPDRDGQIWLDTVSDLLFREWSNPITKFTGSLQEGFYDLSGFGTSIVYQDLGPNRSLHFRSFSPADCWIREDSYGHIDTLHRSTVYTTRQLYQMFEEKILDAIEYVFGDKYNNQRTHEVIHAVFPNSDNRRQGIKDRVRNKNRKFLSVYFLKRSNDTLKIGGYDEFPYHVGREKVVSGQIYGQSNALTHLPAIRMLNAMMKSVIKAANKAIDPPMMVPSEGFIVPLKSDAGALWWYDAGLMNPEAVKVMGSQGRFEISDQLIADVRSQITRGFHVDWLIRNKKNERQTATEIMDDRDEMLRQLSPTLGRIESEKIATIVKRSYNLLKKARRLPPPPPSLSRKRIDIRFQSPSARAQYGARGIDIQRYIQDITPLINLYPSIAQTLDPDTLGQYLARIRNVPSVVLMDEEAKVQLREQEALEKQLNFAAEAAPKAGKAALDIAKAQEVSGATL
jgi:hypothetical protein